MNDNNARVPYEVSKLVASKLKNTNSFAAATYSTVNKNAHELVGKLDTSKLKLTFCNFTKAMRRAVMNKLDGDYRVMLMSIPFKSGHSNKKVSWNGDESASGIQITFYNDAYGDTLANVKISHAGPPPARQEFQGIFQKYGFEDKVQNFRGITSVEFEIQKNGVTKNRQPLRSTHDEVNTMMNEIIKTYADVGGEISIDGNGYIPAAYVATAKSLTKSILDSSVSSIETSAGGSGIRYVTHNGKKYVVRTGVRGGKYITVKGKGKKVYV